MNTASKTANTLPAAEYLQPDGTWGQNNPAAADTRPIPPVIAPEDEELFQGAVNTTDEPGAFDEDDIDLTRQSEYGREFDALINGVAEISPSLTEDETKQMEDFTAAAQAQQPAIKDVPTLEVKIGGSSIASRVFLLDLGFKTLGQSRKAPANLITTDADLDRVRLGKRILDCDEMKAIKQHVAAVRTYVADLTIPTGDQLRGGLHMLPYDLLPKVEAYLKGASDTLALRVDDLVDALPQRIEEDREALKSLFDPNNYPPADRVRSSFRLEFSYVTMATPEGLKKFDRGVYEREKAKLEAQINEAAEESKFLLLEQVKGLTEKIVERLTPGEDGKPKTFKNTMLENLNEFLETFSAKNVTGDEKLAALMDDIKAKVAGRTPDQLRKSGDVREAVRESFAAIVPTLDAIIETRPKRLITFEEGDC
jgi:hypothetical protein